MPAPLPLLLPPLCHPLLPSACRRLFPFATACLLFRYCSHANSRAASSLAALTDAMRVPSRPSPSCQLIRGACGASSCAALHLLLVFLHLRTVVAHMYTFTRVHVALHIIHSRSCYLAPCSALALLRCCFAHAFPLLTARAFLCGRLLLLMSLPTARLLVVGHLLPFLRALVFVSITLVNKTRTCLRAL